MTIPGHNTTTGPQSGRSQENGVAMGNPAMDLFGELTTYQKPPTVDGIRNFVDLHP